MTSAKYPAAKRFNKTNRKSTRMLSLLQHYQCVIKKRNIQQTRQTKILILR